MGINCILEGKLTLKLLKCNEKVIGLEEFIVIICKLPTLLAARRMRVADLIRGTGINKTTLHKLYNGDLTRIDFDTIDRVCDFLDIQVGELFIFERTNHTLVQGNNKDISKE